MEVLLVFWAICGLLAGWIASQKKRSFIEGLVLGSLFGPLGCIVEGCLPNKM